MGCGKEFQEWDGELMEQVLLYRRIHGNECQDARR
jgi:hypothetical protein